MALAYPENRTREEEEKQELEAVLDAGILKKAPNLQHFLKFVAEMYFAGSAGEVKEYSIAINALNRPENFDPQSDTIVRVTAHALRKKLEQYYASEGAEHPIHIRIPTGKYVLQFEHKHPSPLPSLIQPEIVPAPQPQRWNWRRTDIWALPILAAVLLTLVGTYIFRQHSMGAVDRLNIWCLDPPPRRVRPVHPAGRIRQCAFASDRMRILIRMRAGCFGQPTSTAREARPFLIPVT